VIKALILAAVSLVSSAWLAGAQPISADIRSINADIRSQSEEATGADTRVVEAGAHEAGVRFDFSRIADLFAIPALSPVADGRDLRRWLPSPSFQIGSSRLAAHANPGLPARRRISRTFYPIPLLEWRRHSPLVARRAMVAVRPTIVIGRRLTWAPELGRGGRTLGVAVQMRVWLDGAPARPPAGETSPGPARVLSTVRGMLDRR
jgi:hypothetical protein